MNKLPNHTALKEWSNVIESLGRGEQVILIRKGGIADPHFGIEADRFYLYPTYFHQGETDPRTTVQVTHWVEVVRTWSVRDAELLERLQPFVDIPRETLEARYRFRPDQALYVIAVRTFVLPAAVEVRYREEYGGCRSWVSVDDEIDVTGSRQVLEEAELHAKLESIGVILSRGDDEGSPAGSPEKVLRRLRASG
jgi:hypothetical protein